MATFSMTLIEQTFTIHRLKADAGIPKTALTASFFAITRTEEELSIVLPESLEIQSDRHESGWSCFKVDGPLKLDQVGILSEIARTLAKAKIAIFALSTFETDYILVKREQARAAQEALVSAGHKVRKARKKKVQEKEKSVFSVLEKQIPTIRKLLLEKVGPGALKALKSDSAWALALGSIYEFLPTAVRLVIRRETFVDFGLKNKEKLLPEKESRKTGNPRK
jgi:hypothetical protein